MCLIQNIILINYSKDFEERLPKTKLTLLCNYQPVLDYVKDADHSLYQTLVETLIPEVLRPIPGNYHSLVKTLVNYIIRLSKYEHSNINSDEIQSFTCCTPKY